MHHSHATLTVSSLPSASYLTWGSVLETSRPRLCGKDGGPPRRHLWYAREARAKTREPPVAVSNRGFH
jgi:hypothetical protein